MSPNQMRTRIYSLENDLRDTEARLRTATNRASILQDTVDACVRPLARRLAPIAGGAPRQPRPLVTYGNSHGIDSGESYAEWHERHEHGEPTRPLWENDL